MGFLEDLIVGMDAPDYSLVGADLSEEEKRLKREEEYLAYQEELRRIWGARGGQAEAEAASAEKYGLVDRPESPTKTLREIAQGRIKGREDVERERKAASVEAVDRSDAESQDNWVRSVGYEPDQMLSDPDRGILVEEIPAEKLLRIRKQAAERAPGYTGGTGSFSQQDMTPELASREAENARWLGQQPQRDLEYAMTPEMARRSPQAAQSAAQSLADLQRNQQIEARQASVDAIVAKMAGEGGKIPFEQAQQLQMLGVNVPYGSTGMSKDQGVEFFDSAIAEAGKFLSSINPLEAVGNPAVGKRAEFERHGALLAEDYRRKVLNGMNSNDASDAWKREMSMLAIANGFMNMQEIGQQTQQMQQPQASQ